jgi:hypothetical protein
MGFLELRRTWSIARWNPSREPVIVRSGTA